MSSGLVGKSVVKNIGPRSVVCRELTVAQVRELLQQKEGTDLVDELLLDGLRLVDLPVFTGLGEGELAEMLPSELEVIVAGCKEANPSFFRMLDRASNLQPKA